MYVHKVFVDIKKTVYSSVELAHPHLMDQIFGYLITHLCFCICFIDVQMIEVGQNMSALWQIVCKEYNFNISTFCWFYCANCLLKPDRDKC